MTVPDPDWYGPGAYYGPWQTLPDIEVVHDGALCFTMPTGTGLSWNQYDPGAPDPGSRAGYLESAWQAVQMGWGDSYFVGSGTGTGSTPLGPSITDMSNVGITTETQTYLQFDTQSESNAPEGGVSWNAGREPRGFFFGGSAGADIVRTAASFDASYIIGEFHHYDPSDPHFPEDTWAGTEWDGEAQVLKVEIARLPYSIGVDGGEFGRVDSDDVLELRASDPAGPLGFPLPWMTPDLYLTETDLIWSWPFAAGATEIGGSTDWHELPSYFTTAGVLHLCTYLGRQWTLPPVAVGHEGVRQGWAVEVHPMWTLRCTIRPARRRYILTPRGPAMRPGARRDAVVFRDAR